MTTYSELFLLRERLTSGPVADDAELAALAAGHPRPLDGLQPAEALVRAVLYEQL